MQEWVQRGHAVLVEARHAGQPAAFALIIVFGAGAYYGSACKDPDLADIPASHLIQWETIRWLKAQRFEWYDLGPQQFSPQWFDPGDPKQVSISLFKRGFGGLTIPLVTAEFFYSKPLLEQAVERRWREYLEALVPELATA
jgi:lipid II:glycine glycyltransferase (peptidoglycan interpeptide bridge formation enzyme)